MATVERREPASCDRLPVIGVSLQPHRSESPTGYSSAGCSPAEPASASPVTDNSSSIPIRRGNQMRRSTSLQGYRPAFGCDALSRRSCLPPTGCHLYFAHRVTFLSCADTSCRSPIETSPASPIEMSRSDFWVHAVVDSVVILGHISDFPRNGGRVLTADDHMRRSALVKGLGRLSAHFGHKQAGSAAGHAGGAQRGRSAATHRPRLARDVQPGNRRPAGSGRRDGSGHTPSRHSERLSTLSQT